MHRRIAGNDCTLENDKCIYGKIRTIFDQNSKLIFESFSPKALKWVGGLVSAGGGGSDRRTVALLISDGNDRIGANYTQERYRML